jgi:hypothetical protein
VHQVGNGIDACVPGPDATALPCDGVTARQVYKPWAVVAQDESVLTVKPPPGRGAGVSGAEASGTGSGRAVCESAAGAGTGAESIAVTAETTDTKETMKALLLTGPPES